MPMDNDSGVLGELSDKVPFNLRIGSIGFGAGIGCGVGIGFGSPLNLGAVPALGQAVQGISSGLSAAGGAAGGLGLGSGAGVREAVRRLGVKGLDAGLGCGVGIGYGFGAGLFLRPSAVEQAARALEHAAGHAVKFVQGKLHELGVKQGQGQGQGQGQPAGGAGGATALQSGDGLEPTDAAPGIQHTTASYAPAAGAAPFSLVSNGGGGASTPFPAHELHGTPARAPAASLGSLLSPSLGGLGAGVTGVGPTGMVGAHSVGQGCEDGGAGEQHLLPSAQAPGQQQQQQLTDELRTLLRHEREIARLREQNRALRQAVCRIDKRLPVCRDHAGDDDDIWR